MRYVIDRFEGKYAILEAENYETTGIERARLPIEAAEGDVLEHKAGYWSIDMQETARRRERIKNKLKNLWAD